MSLLLVYDEHQPQQFDKYALFDQIVRQLSKIGVQFERWQADFDLPPDADQETILSAYAPSIQRLKRDFGFQSVDVINLTPEHPDKTALRQKFLSEHIHEDFEIRFFIEGYGLFYLHVDEKVFAVLCRQGDLISVPANTPHWFDMGENPSFKAIRLFTTPDGWVAKFTGSEIAKSFPSLDELLDGSHD